jgi:hypothetical protein
VQGKSEASESAENGTVPGTGPEAGEIKVGDGCGVVNGTEPGVVASNLDADIGFPAW